MTVESILYKHGYAPKRELPPGGLMGHMRGSGLHQRILWVHEETGKDVFVYISF